MVLRQAIHAIPKSWMGDGCEAARLSDAVGIILTIDYL